MILKGGITKFINGTVSLIDENTGNEICVPYIPNGNFNHTYIGEIIELIIDETGIATDCINERHKL